MILEAKLNDVSLETIKELNDMLTSKGLGSLKIVDESTRIRRDALENLTTHWSLEDIEGAIEDAGYEVNDENVDAVCKAITPGVSSAIVADINERIAYIVQDTLG